MFEHGARVSITFFKAPAGLPKERFSIFGRTYWVVGDQDVKDGKWESWTVDLEQALEGRPFHT